MDLLVVIFAMLAVFCDVSFATLGECIELAGASAESAEASPVFSPSGVNADEIGRRLYAVHATSFIPEGGVIPARTTPPFNSPGAEPPSFRPTLHFALGELVRPRDGFSWEGEPYAIVVPLGSLVNQLVNINTYDTFVLGSLRLPRGTILVMPSSEAHKAPPGVAVQTYEATETLRSAVERTIARQGGWPVRMANSAQPSAVATVQGHNINRPEFFAPFMRANPRVSFGSHSTSQSGTAFRYGIIDGGIQRVTRVLSKHPLAPSAQSASFICNVIRHHLERLDSEIRTGNWPESVVRTFNEKKNSVLEWLRRVEEALRLTPTAGGSPPPRLEARIVAEQVQGTPLSEMRELTKDLVRDGKISAIEMQKATALYALRRALILNPTSARTEGVIDLLDTSFQAVAAHRGSGREFFETTMRILSSHLDTRSDRLPDALAMMQRPAVRAALEQHLGLSIPATGAMTLEGFLRGYPVTRVLFEPTATAGSASGRLILDTLEPSPPTKNLQSLSEAIEAVTELGYRQRNLETIGTPMATTPELALMRPGSPSTFYSAMRMGRFGTLDSVWENLGLRAEFREVFPRDEDFWRSPLSMEQIHLQLTARRRRG